jgi:hypothetical protein
MKKRFWILLIGLAFAACDKEEDPGEVNQDNFDRAAMLANWADNMIIPAYEAYDAELATLSVAKDEFLANTTETNLLSLRESWLDAYIAWQKVSMFEIGKAEQVSLRDYTNVYPTDAGKIEEYLTGNDYNLTLPSTRSQQGFPALDYLLNGAAETDAEIVARFNDSQAMKDYLDVLVVRLTDLTGQVLEDWKNGYRETFVGSDGSQASSSVNKLVNDFLFYYEKALRAGKVGIPAGVFSNTPLSDRVEAFYKKDVSKMLFEAAFEAVADFFNGRHFNGTGAGESLASYLNFVNAVSGGEQLSALINAQFGQTRKAAEALGDNFYEAVEMDNLSMLKLFDALQANVVLMKVDMFQALNIKVDFVDADGD